MNNKGFTLLELLAVLAILGIVGFLAAPQISPIFDNIRRDQILNEARDIERAARYFCNSQANLCEVGERLYKADIDHLVSNQVNPDYDYRVTVLYTGQYAVYYAKEDALSFPFNPKGYLATSERVPTLTSRDFVNIPRFFGGDYPDWDPALDFDIGDRYKYDEVGVEDKRSWEILTEYGTENPPPTESDNPDDYEHWQEVGIDDAFRFYNDYVVGEMVSYEYETDKYRFYYLLHEDGNGEEPPTSINWQEITNRWREYNVYYAGDIVWWHQDPADPNNDTMHQYQALSDNFYGIEPGTESAFGDWQNISTNLWNQYNTYNQGDIVYHNDEKYEAREDINTISQNLEPGQDSGEKWLHIPAEDWDPLVSYYEGDIVLRYDTLYQARWYTKGDDPDHYDPSDPEHFVWWPVE